MVPASQSAKETFDGIFSRCLQLGSTPVTDDMSMESVSSWDSFNTLLLIGELEKGFAVKFSPDESRMIRDVRSIKEIMRGHGIAV